jgi:hypothetical protein
LIPLIEITTPVGIAADLKYLSLNQVESMPARKPSGSGTGNICNNLLET